MEQYYIDMSPDGYIILTRAEIIDWLRSRTPEITDDEIKAALKRIGPPMRSHRGRPRQGEKGNTP